ncbi:hypothetical protein HOP50_11g63080 [Chloropicon primus]|nr:hypothetical protein HOP50_11g63080 [Chloropicon primus]
MAVKKKIEKKKAPAKKSQEAKAKANPTKPRRGTFEVRCGGKAIASFEAMPRPFKALREADLEQIAKEAIRCLALK